MRPLEIPTQKFFNNSIKNQKPGSDSVLNHSTTVSSVQRPESKVQRTESSVQSPASNTCVQSPGNPVYSKTSKTKENVRSENSTEYHL